MVAAGLNDVVTLRNLRLTGIRHTGLGGLNGVQITSGAVVHIDNCQIFGFSQSGINVVPNGGASQVFVLNTILSDNGNGAVLAPSGAGFTRLLAVRTQAQTNSASGFAAIGTGGTAVVCLKRSQAIGNGASLSANSTNAIGIINASQLSPTKRVSV